MESIFSHFLEVACTAFRAARVGLRIVWNGDGNPFVLAEQWFEADGSGHRIATGPGALQMPLFPAGAALMEERAAVPRDECFAGRCDSGAAVPWGRDVEGHRRIVDPQSRPMDGWNVSVLDHEFRCTGLLDEFMIDFRAFLTRESHDRGNDAERQIRRLIPLLEWLVESCCPLDGSGRRAEPNFSPPFIGDSRAISDIKRQTSLVARSDVPVLIEGESGTGKEVIARNIHALGPRSARPLVILNCLEMPPALVQSELFGHVKGSFTGASRDRIGLVESADGGTLFLDEVGEMPRSLQATLLRVLQEKEVRRVGESARRRVDVRFVFATNRRLRELLESKRFRLDLFHRMSSVRIHIPPLRERRIDIPPLTRHFLELASARYGDRARRVTSGAMRRFLAHLWPGNVRELRNEIERLIALYPDARRIDASMLSPHVGIGDMDPLEEGPLTLPEAVRRLERRMIREALETFRGNRTRTARHLGITRQGLLKKLKRHGIMQRPSDTD